MAAVQVMNSQGNSIKGTSALRSSDPQTKKKAISIFKRLKDKFSKKKKPTKGVVHNFLGKDFERNEMLNPPNYLDNQAPTPVNSPEEENLVNRGKRDKKSGQPKFGTFRNETKENVMKITKTQIREIIREELQGLNEIKSGLTDDIKKFKTEYDVKHGKLKEKALKLHERQQIMKAVSMVNEKIMGALSELDKLPVTDALENVKKTHANKYIRAIETLKGICEQNAGWLKENK